jgi:hypothetical protein
VGFPRFPQPRHFHSSLVFPPSFRRLQASSSPLRADAGRLVLRSPVGRLCFTDLPCILKRPITCGPYRIDTSPFRCSWIVTVQPASELRNRVLSIRHSRSPIATVLSLATTRSVCAVKIQSRSVRPLRRNAVPFAAEATQNLPLNSSMYRFRKNSLACSRSVIPANRNSCGKRPCQVPKLLSDRPRACGEYAGIICTPNSFIARPTCVNRCLSTFSPAFGVTKKWL